MPKMWVDKWRQFKAGN